MTVRKDHTTLVPHSTAMNAFYHGSGQRNTHVYTHTRTHVRIGCNGMYRGTTGYWGTAAEYAGGGIR